MAAPRTDTTNDHYHHAANQTELQRALLRGLKQIEPFQNYLLVAGLAIAIVGLGSLVWYRTTVGSQSVGWQEFMGIKAPDDFAALADKYPNAPVGAWARLEAGRGYLNEGLAAALTDRVLSNERLQKAKSSFERLVNEKVDEQVREEALYGLATSLEALSNGDTQPAINAYRQLLDEFRTSQHRLWAKERIDQLSSKPASEFYAWFQKQNPKPADRPQPRDVSTAPPLGETVDFDSLFGGTLQSGGKKEPPASPQPPDGDQASGDAPAGAALPELPAADESPAPADQKPAQEDAPVAPPAEQAP